MDFKASNFAVADLPVIFSHNIHFKRILILIFDIEREIEKTFPTLISFLFHLPESWVYVQN